jgi:hypothetical protein
MLLRVHCVSGRCNLNACPEDFATLGSSVQNENPNTGTFKLSSHNMFCKLTGILLTVHVASAFTKPLTSSSDAV